MMTVNRYADLVTQIMETNEIDVYLEDHEVEWVVSCFNADTKPSDCVFGLGEIRLAYTAEVRRLQMWDRIDAQLMRKAA